MNRIIAGEIPSKYELLRLLANIDDFRQFVNFVFSAAGLGLVFSQYQWFISTLYQPIVSSVVFFRSALVFCSFSETFCVFGFVLL
jgi:hypothetical protein